MSTNSTHLNPPVAVNPLYWKYLSFENQVNSDFVIFKNQKYEEEKDGGDFNPVIFNLRMDIQRLFNEVQLLTKLIVEQ